MPISDSGDQRPPDELASPQPPAALPSPNSVPPGDDLADDDEPLVDLEVQGSGRALTAAALQLLSDGRSRFKTVSVFDFVPCNYELFWDMLDGQPRGTFCEYGSGFGIATGLAELLGFDALGIELAPDLVTASRELLAAHGLKAHIELGNYLQRRDQADIYFTYAWPSHMRLIEEHFYETAKPNSRLLYCYGQDDIRCKVIRSR